MIEVKFEDIPDGKSIDDYPEDTIFVLDDSEVEKDEWALAAKREREREKLQREKNVK